MLQRSRIGRRGGARVTAGLAVLALLLVACGGAEDVGDPESMGADDAVAEEQGDAGDDDAGDGDAGDDDAEESSASFYDDVDMIEFLVPFGTGGGTDTLARMIAPFFTERLGVPVQVVNVPGGGSVIGANEYVNQREPDGTNILFTSASTHTPPLLGEDGVRFGFDDLVPVAGFPLGGVYYVHADSPFEDGIDLTGPHQPDHLVYAGMPAAGAELRILLTWEMFETDVTNALGFDGRGPARLAWESGESNINYDTAPAYISNAVPLIEDGVARPLMTFGTVENNEIVSDPAFPDIPHPGEVYEAAFGEHISNAGPAYEAYKVLGLATVALNKTMALHADAPPEAIQEVRDLWEDLLDDDTFIETAEAELGGYPILLADEAAAAWEQLASIDVDSPQLQWLFQWLEDEYDVVFE